MAFRTLRRITIVVAAFLAATVVAAPAQAVEDNDGVHSGQFVNGWGADRATNQPAARITTTVVDAATGRPLAGVCLQAYELGKLDDKGPADASCSNNRGRVTIDGLSGGDYRLFAEPRSTTYGRQWVGATGGTGDVRRAAVVSVTAGQLAKAPRIRVDRAGAIAGTVTDAETGQPIVGARVGLFAMHPGLGAPDVETDDQGRYRIAALGPYAWPLMFDAYGSAHAWTGGAVNRYAATRTRVTAGETATADIALRDGVVVDGTIRLADGRNPDGGYVVVRNARTGDISGDSWAQDGRFAAQVLPGQRVYLSYDIYIGEEAYSAERVPGEVVRVPETGLTIEIVVPTG